MKILLVSDEESPLYWEHYSRGRLDGIDLIISCGDLKAAYLEFLVTMAKAPVLYVRGNHDTLYEQHPPEGCDCIENKVVTVKGLRIMGLGGSRMYNGGSDQYTERQMRRRIARLALKLRRSGGVDIVVTHAPPRGFGDDTDYAHQGFEAFLPMLEKYKPKYLVHGHVHTRYGAARERIVRCGETEVINASGYYLLEL